MITGTHQPGCAFDDLPPESQRVCMHALVDDVGALALLMDRDGVILAANAAAEAIVEPEHRPLAGRNFADVVDPLVAAEKIALLRRAIETGKPVNLVGMCRGLCSRSIIRRLPTRPGEPSLVLYVARAFTEADRAIMESGHGDWVRAENFDLGPLVDLTARELEVLRLISLSLSTADIAQRLHRSVKTIEWHRVSLGSKLGATNRVELARIANAAGLANLDDQTFARLVHTRGEALAPQPF